jgi:polyferredoxin
MVNKIKVFEKEIKEIKERNKRVELDKEWELSWARKLIIAILTYLVIVIFFYFAELPKPWLNSIVPALAFVISTLTLNIFKKIWLRKVIKK